MEATEHTIVCAVPCRVEHTKLRSLRPSSLSIHCPPLARSAADLMHGYQFATPRAILHIGWYWTIHHAARHRHIAHPPLTLQMLLPTSTRCAAAERATREERGREHNAFTFRALSEVERIHNPWADARTPAPRRAANRIRLVGKTSL